MDGHWACFETGRFRYDGSSKLCHPVGIDRGTDEGLDSDHLSSVELVLWAQSGDPKALHQLLERLLPQALYEGRLEKKLDTAEAVREASLTVLSQRRKAGRSTHPFYWAAFVAAGDWPSSRSQPPVGAAG